MMSCVPWSTCVYHAWPMSVCITGSASETDWAVLVTLCSANLPVLLSKCAVLRASMMHSLNLISSTAKPPYSGPTDNGERCARLHHLTFNQQWIRKHLFNSWSQTHLWRGKAILCRGQASTWTHPEQHSLCILYDQDPRRARPERQFQIDETRLRMGNTSSYIRNCGSSVNRSIYCGNGGLRKEASWCTTSPCLRLHGMATFINHFFLYQSLINVQRRYARDEKTPRPAGMTGSVKRANTNAHTGKHSFIGCTFRYPLTESKKTLVKKEVRWEWRLPFLKRLKF